MQKRGNQRWWIWLFWIPAIFLIWLVFKQVPLNQVWKILSRLSAWQIILLICVNLGLLWAFSRRWWLILQHLCCQISWSQLSAYRLASFGISYFTPGPQFGGEPVQVLLLTRRHKIPLSTALSSVFTDRLIELLANFTFLAIGIATILTYGHQVSGLDMGNLLIPAGLLVFPILHLVLLWLGITPASLLVGRIQRLLPHKLFQQIYLLILRSEQEISTLCRNKPGVVIRSIWISGIVWVMMIGEYWLTLWFSGGNFNLAQVVSALTAARLAYLLPVPAGLGTLETSQVLAMQALGADPAIGLAASLLIRARDISLGLLGLWLGSRAFHT
ncbi:MAG TPA: lysylphosphatidylglycerol synthase transmembrane domain-containing protein [Anaerolineaceae bacterium]